LVASVFHKSSKGGISNKSATTESLTAAGFQILGNRRRTTTGVHVSLR